MSEPRSDDGRGPGDEPQGGELAALARLHRLAVEFLRDGELPRLLDACLSEALAITGADRGCLQILHGPGGGLRLGAQRGLVRPFLEYVANLRVGLGGSVVTAGERHVLFADVATSAALAGSADREALLLAEVRALHALPLRTPDGRVVGVLSVLHRDRPDPQPLAREAMDRGALDRVADLCAAAITNARAAPERIPAPADADVATRLRETQELFSNTVENLPVSMVLCDRAGRVLYVDPALGEMVRALCGLSPAALVGKPGAEIWPPFVWDPLEASMRKAVETGQRQTYELAFTVPSGDVNYRHWIVLPLAGDDGQVHRVLGINHDVTAERRLLDELRGADRRKSEFIGVLSHELRNPLVRHPLGPLRARAETTPRRGTPRRSIIDRQVRHLVHLVDDLLDITRISQNKIQLKRQPVDWPASCTRRSRTAARTSRRANVTLEVAAGPGAAPRERRRRPHRAGDREPPVQRRKVHAGGRHRAPCRSSRRDGAAVLAVADTGAGIEAAVMPRCSSRSCRPRARSKRAGGGLGLGLALVRGLVELMAGEVTAPQRGQRQGRDVRRAPSPGRAGRGGASGGRAPRRRPAGGAASS